MFENRSAIYHNLAGCVVGTAWGAATSLLGSVAVCRLCGVSPELAVVLGNKGISSPFALAGAAALGANEPLTVTYVILSGVCKCSRSLCVFFRSLKGVAAQTAAPSDSA